MKRFSRRLYWGLLAGALLVSACGSAEAEVASATHAAAADPPEVRSLDVIRNALGKVSLRPEQTTEVEQLFAQAKQRHQAIHTAHVALRNGLADQVQAGRIDRSALEPQLDALLTAVDQSRPADRAALVRLHDLLDKSQRDQFVTALESEFRAHKHGGRGHGGPRQWAEDLRLTDQQRAQIRTAAERTLSPGREAMKEHWRAGREHGQKLLQSFRDDKFVLDANSPLFGRDKIARGIERMLDLAGAAVPVLTPEQRAIAAQKIRR